MSLPKTLKQFAWGKDYYTHLHKFSRNPENENKCAEIKLVCQATQFVLVHKRILVLLVLVIIKEMSEHILIQERL